MAKNIRNQNYDDKQGILSRIQNFLTFGYGKKENLRELDKALRDQYYEELQNIRHVWEEVYLNIIDGQVEDSIHKRAKKILNVLDRTKEKIHRASYGYAGLYDRKGHIREKELARVLSYDEGISNQIGRVKTAVEKIRVKSEGQKMDEIESEIKEIRDFLFELENTWNEREKQFRPVML